MICYICSQNSFSRANGDRRSLIEKHVVVFVRSNLPQKLSTVLSELEFVPPLPNQNFLDITLFRFVVAAEPLKSVSAINDSNLQHSVA